MKNIAPPKPSVLCVFAHPDDESFSCAGTMARYVPEGVAFHVLSFTPGQAAKRPEPIDSAEELALLREFELRAAGEVLGIVSVSVLGYEDGRLDQASPEELIHHVKDALDRTQADTIITFGPHGLTEHDDHKAAHRAALQAAEEYGRNLTVFLIALDPGHTNGVHGPEARPTHRIDVTACRDKKLAALACHASQEDARNLFLSIACKERDEERYHQIYPPAAQGRTRRELFEGLEKGPARLERATTDRARAS
jgi:LmbE family N-acetylglucosaminyl deacetylase